MHLASIFLMVAPPNMQSAGQIKGSQGARVRTGWSSKILSIKNCKTQNTKRGEVATKTDAEGYVTSYEYNGNGNCVKMTTVDGDTLSMSTILWTVSSRPPHRTVRVHP